MELAKAAEGEMEGVTGLWGDQVILGDDAELGESDRGSIL